MLQTLVLGPDSGLEPSLKRIECAAQTCWDSSCSVDRNAEHNTGLVPAFRDTVAASAVASEGACGFNSGIHHTARASFLHWSLLLQLYACTAPRPYTSHPFILPT